MAIVLPTLRKGSRGDNVVTLQEILREHGYYLGDIDGIFGSKTKEAVKAFQRAHGLAQDGIVGPKTWAELEGANAGRSAVYRLGSKGEFVGKIQERLINWGLYGEWDSWGFCPYQIDDYYGPRTVDAIKTLQRGMGLLPDGIAGPITLNVLFGPILEWTKISDKLFTCKCGGQYCSGLPAHGIDPAIKMQLVRFEERIGGRPYVITSGYRCPKWNKKAGGASKSQHLYGRAADVYVDGMSVKEVNKIFDELNSYGGVGLNGARITHDDSRGIRARWDYN